MKQRTEDREPLEHAYDWARREYSRRMQADDCATHCSRIAAEVMAEAEKRYQLDTYGVEGFAINPQSGIQYLNTGDPYGRTIVFRAKSRNAGLWNLGSWGDMAERMAL